MKHNVYGQIQQMNIDQMVNEFVQFFKNSGELQEKTLAIPLRFSAEVYEKNQKRFFREITLLFHGGSYTTVAWTTASKLDVASGEISEVEFEACHDSCWREGTSRIIQLIALDADKVFDAKDNPNIFNSFGILSIELLNVKLKGDYNTKKARIFKNVEKEK